MSRQPLQIGDRVELLTDQAPYYSGYAGNPVVKIPKGSVGIVGAPKVPTVHGPRSWFACVDFVLPGVFQGRPELGYTTWRCGVYLNDCRKTDKPLSCAPIVSPANNLRQ